jgi:uncharacterized OB-fold protein
MMAQMPLVDYLVLGAPPYLRGTVCADCKAIYLDRRFACGRCGGVQFTSRRLADTGVIRAFTVIHRAAPGIAVPYTSVIVDLDGGGVVKANLTGDPDPEQVRPGARVHLCTHDGATDSNGDVALVFSYELDRVVEGACA